MKAGLMLVAGLAPMLLAVLPQDEPQAAADSRPVARAEDTATPESLTAALYDVISGPAGKARDWARFRSLFSAEARLIAVRTTPDGRLSSIVMTPEDYEKRAGPVLEKRGFFERGIASETAAFGSVAHVFSTYESRNLADAAPFARGINSIQMVRGPAGWRVTSLAWDEESPTRPIPERHLPKK